MRNTQLETDAAELGLTVHTWAPGDGCRRYRFFRDAPASQTYYGPADGIYTALGEAEGLHFLSGYRCGLRAKRTT